MRHFSFLFLICGICLFPYPAPAAIVIDLNTS